MRVLLAGAAGALGTAVVPRLLAAGHEVVALTRRPPTAVVPGVAVGVGDLLDAGSLRRVLESSPVDAVVHAAKAIPERGPLTFRDMRATNRLHETGTRNLLQAAQGAGVSRVVAESVVFAYGYGDRGSAPLGEDSPTQVAVPPGCRPIHGALLSMEQQVLAAPLAGVVLRYGLYYGPGATDRLAAMVRRRAAPLPRSPEGLWPLVHVEDAADALVAALTAPPGVYNVADDEPVPPRRFLEAIASALGAPRPLSLPRGLMSVVAPYFTTVATSRLPLTSTRREVLGWRPGHPSYREGVASWLGA